MLAPAAGRQCDLNHSNAEKAADGEKAPAARAQSRVSPGSVGRAGSPTYRSSTGDLDILPHDEIETQPMPALWASHEPVAEVIWADQGGEIELRPMVTSHQTASTRWTPA
jgi:hypothetical protein